MATDMQPDRPDGPGRESRERWQRAWSHREDLLKVARRRSVSAEDAEDAVHEAMLRAAEHPDLDDERLGAWLTTVTMRLCVDRHRQVHREAQVRSSPRLHPPGPVPVEEAVCDRAEANWLAVRSSELPARQAEALWLKAEDLDVGQVASKMGLSYRTVESLLARARRTLRNSLAATLGLVLWLCGRGRPHGGGNAQAVALASTAVTLAVAGLVLPYVHDGDTPRPRPAPPAVTEAAGSGAPEPGATGAPGNAAPSPPGTRAATDGARPAGERGLPLPELPRVPLPALPLSTPPVSGLPVPQAEDLVPSLPPVPSASVPAVPSSVPAGPTPSASVPTVPVPSAPVPTVPVPPAQP
ncbi:sigma-70 family RNA polymerase sigma factor [Streptomyces pristinaespiralis]|uniref:RNA polymerase sigma factor n=1 Tax=Streptomyces pristinaespiralis TaxID=38300 RepID=A0A0M4D6W3_STRPR|nr:sigma-70 family RNA polymerase sigma factor [Streptomyces pristinaespiralis]ALC19865.1 RNA polymerase sigma factor [Streptomyces pristinaespiralis]QMU17178.1 sigma-70 family RNA polymerase sigma factor [Streptomyces pristinaespiralis]